jgi:hypothetical protein
MVLCAYIPYHGLLRLLWTQAEQKQCFCGYGGMTREIPACISCSTARCSVCKLESHWKNRERGLYTWSKDAALRKEAALLGPTTTEHRLIHPPDVGNATTAVTCTTLKPGPTSCQLSSQQALHPGTTPTHVTQQSLSEHETRCHWESRSPPTVRNGAGFDLSSLSLTQVDAGDLVPDLSSLAFQGCSVSEPVTGWTYPLTHQPDNIDTIIAVFRKWRAECNITSHGSSAPNSSESPEKSQLNQPSGQRPCRKRTSDQGSTTKQSVAKKPKATNAPAHRSGKEDKRRLACPFWKKDPIRHRKCFVGFTRIAYVKQDLRRHHRRPMRVCRRCGTDFGDREAEFTEHSRTVPPCENRVFPDPDGMTPEQEAELGKYPDRRSTEEEQWYFMWKCLFPAGPDGQPPPAPPSSPYVDQDLSEDMSSFREFSRRDGWRVLANDPALSDFAFHISEELFDRCLGRLYDTWLAKRRSTASLPPTWEESPLPLSDTSSPDELVQMNDAPGINFQPGHDGSMTALGDFSVTLDFATNFSGYQADGMFGSLMGVPSRDDDDLAQMFPSVPLLTFDNGVEPAPEVITLNPALISR